MGYILVIIYNIAFLPINQNPMELVLLIKYEVGAPLWAEEDEKKNSIFNMMKVIEVSYLIG